MKKISLLIAISCFVAASVYGMSAENLTDDGRRFYEHGKFEQAALAFKQSLDLTDKKDTTKYLERTMLLGSAYQSLGYHQRAIAAYKEALPIVQQSKDVYRNILFLSQLGDLYLTMGDVSEAVKYITESVEKASESDNPAVFANVLNNAGNAFAADHDYESAIDSYTQALDLTEKIKSPDRLKAAVLLNIARAEFMIGEEKDIAPAIDNAFSHIANMPDDHDKASYLISLSQLARKIYRTTPQINVVAIARKSLTQAKDIASDIKDHRILSYAYGYLAELYEDEKRYSEATEFNRKAVFFAHQDHYPQILYLLQWQAGRLFKETGNSEQAIKSYRQAVDTLTPIRGQLFRGFRVTQDIFNESVKPVYLGLADLLFRQAERAENDKDRESRLKEARDVMETLKTSELQDFFADECVIALKQKNVTIDRSQPHTAVVYPISLPDRLVIMLTLPDRLMHINVPVSENQLRETATNFRLRLQTRPNNRFMYESKKLYDWMIRPIETELKNAEVDTLVIAPDGPMRLIPFSTLSDGKQFLVEKYAIATVPAITLTDPKPLKIEEANIFLSGLSDSVQDFSPLPSVTAELRDIKTIMGGKILLQNKDYNIGNLTENFKQEAYSIVHLATHGVFGGTPSESFLLTYDDKLTMDKLEWLIGLSRFREKQVELLTLSACQTALGNERAGLGLAGVAIKAGVRTAVATLWFVDDEATSLAIREFYRQLKKPGISKAKALQNAQKMLIAQLRYNHPAYWGPFLLIGNWM